MASDLISRSAVIKALKNEKREAERDGEEYGGESILYAEAYVDAIELVKRIPAVDAVEVVRCKDCKHCFLWKIPFCDAEIGLLPIPHNIETWYCPFGERKENAID